MNRLPVKNFKITGRRIEFEVQTSNFYLWVLFFSAIVLVLTFIGLATRFNYVGGTSIIWILLMGKIEYLNFGWTFSILACFYDFLYTCLHTSNASWYPAKIAEFILRLIVCVFEMLWMFSIYIYSKQEEALKNNKTFLTSLGEKFKILKPKDPLKKTTEPSSKSENKPSTPGTAAEEAKVGENTNSTTESEKPSKTDANTSPDSKTDVPSESKEPPKTNEDTSPDSKTDVPSEPKEASETDDSTSLESVTVEPDKSEDVKKAEETTSPVSETDEPDKSKDVKKTDETT